MNSCPTLGRTRIHARDIISLEYFVLGQNIISGRTKYYCKKLSHRTNYGWDRFSHDSLLPLKICNHMFLKFLFESYRSLFLCPLTNYLLQCYCYNNQDQVIHFGY